MTIMIIIDYDTPMMVMVMVMVNRIVRSFHGLTGWGDRGVGSDEHTIYHICQIM